MTRSCLMAFAATAVVSSAAVAQHPGRPENVPAKGSAHLWFIDGQGVIRGSERGAPGSVDIYIYGWSFDSSFPDSSFVPSGPADTRTNVAVSDRPWLYAYNLTSFTYDQINVELLKLSPNAPIGPQRIAMFDFSTLKLTNSFIKSDVIAASDFSKVEISNTQLTGELRMRSIDTMTLSQVSPLRRLGEVNSLRLIAEGGRTNIAFSTLDSIAVRDRAQITVTDSIIRGRVSNDRIDLLTSGFVSTTLSETEVESLSAAIGSMTMTGGRVKGNVSASGVTTDSLRPGRVSLDGVAVEGSLLATTFGRISASGGSISGNVTAGDASDAPAKISLHKSHVSGTVRAVGRGSLDLAFMPSIGALQASGDSRVALSFGNTIWGGVRASGKSQVEIKYVDAIEGDAFADQSARLQLENTSASVVGAFSDSTVTMTGGRALSVVANGGDVALQGVEVTDQIVAFGKSNLTFSNSRVGHNITNVGDGTGMVWVESGLVGGDLVGLGRSVTAMSGGQVRGAPVFSDQATFRYSGGTFDFAGTTEPGTPDDVAARASGSDGRLDLVSTSLGLTALGDATIQFIGFGLQSTLVDADHAEGGTSYSVYQLTGRLADQSSVDGGLVFIQNAVGTSHFELLEAQPLPVPEPSAAALWVLGLVSLGLCGRARRGARADPPAGFA